MKRTVIAVGAAFFLVLSVALTALAQSDALAWLLNPLAVKIQQAVPVELTVAAAQDDGSVITSTVPLTVGVDLVIIIQGSQVVSLTADTSETIVAVQALPVGEEMVDASGIPYTLESMDGFVLSAVSGETPKSEKFRLSGELLNEGDSEGHVQIAVTLYDAQETFSMHVRRRPHCIRYRPVARCLYHESRRCGLCRRSRVSNSDCAVLGHRRPGYHMAEFCYDCIKKCFRRLTHTTTTLHMA